jgi:hypothetical protein
MVFAVHDPLWCLLACSGKTFTTLILLPSIAPLLVFHLKMMHALAGW